MLTSGEGGTVATLISTIGMGKGRVGGFVGIAIV